MSEENDIYIALWDFMIEFTTADANHVFQGWPNRAPVSTDDNFIYMSILNQSRQSTNIHEINVAGDEEAIFQPVRIPIQIDCFGSESLTWATTISTLLRDLRGTEYLEARGITCLFSDEAKNLTGVSLGSDQNVSRWMVEAEIQRIAGVTLATETMTEAIVETIEVYSKYPA
jgi:hypothetical protein